MKKMIMLGIVGMVLVSFASAGLVGFLSNAVNGEIEIFGPVFYFDKTEIMDDGSWSLRLNDDDVLGTYFELTAGDTDSKEFFSESLGVDGFYPMAFEVVVDAEVENLNESSGESGAIHMFVFLSRESGSVRKMISLCETIYLGVNDVRKEREIICDVGDALVDIEEGDRIKVLLNDGSPRDAIIKIYLGESRMQMVAI